MLSRQHYRRSAEDSVDTSCEHTNLLVAVFDGKLDKRTFTTPDPITLSLQNFLGPTGFDLFHVSDQLFGVVSNAQEPLFQISLLDWSSTTPADAAGRLFIRQHGLFFRTPVDLRD